MKKHPIPELLGDEELVLQVCEAGTVRVRGEKVVLALLHRVHGDRLPV